nr:mitochondrial inner membrane protease subunit 1 isoform X2 [Chelonoidis abingdonii]
MLWSGQIQSTIKGSCLRIKQLFFEPAAVYQQHLDLWITELDTVFQQHSHQCQLQRGDIVIAKSPNDPKSNICKRVIGLEGDKVCISSPSDFRKSHSYNILLGGQSKAWAQSKDLVCLQLLWRQEHSLTWKVYKENSQMIPPFVPVVHSTLLLSCSHRNQYRHLIHTTELKSRRLLECFGSSHSGLSTEGWSWSQAGCQSLFCLQPAGRITSILLYNTDCQIWRVLKRRLRSKKEIFLVEMRIPQ